MSMGEAIATADWLKVGLAIDPMKMIRLVEEHNIPITAKGEKHPGHNHATYTHYNFPGAFRISCPATGRNWMLLAHLGVSDTVLRIHELDYDPSECQTRTCEEPCECEEDLDGYIEEYCAPCNGDCECEVCEHPSLYCWTHDEDHPALS